MAVHGLWLACALGSGCTAPNPATGVAPMNLSADLQAPAQAALSDASRRTGIDVAALKLLGAEHVTWPDGSLGCPAQGRVYTQALVRGVRIRIEAQGDTLDYHASENGTPVLCPSGRARPPVGDNSRM